MKRSERPPPPDILETGGKIMMITEQMIYPAIMMIIISAYCIAGNLEKQAAGRSTNQPCNVCGVVVAPGGGR